MESQNIEWKEKWRDEYLAWGLTQHERQEASRNGKSEHRVEREMAG